MAEIKSRFVSLPSNASLDLFPDNNPAEYTVKLPERITHSHGWECGLCFLSFPNAYATFADHQWIEIVSTEYKDAAKKIRHKRIGLAMIPGGVYETAQRLCELISAAVDTAIWDMPGKLTEEIGIEYEDRRILVSSGLFIPSDPLLKPYKIAPVFTGRLLDILGLPTFTAESHAYCHPLKHKEDPSLDAKENQVLDSASFTDLEKRRPVDMLSGRSNLFVYADCVSYSIVGDVMAPLLRVVDAESGRRFGTEISQVFTAPLYFPLSKNSIEYITVRLCDELGSSPKFLFGTAQVVLHFRVRDGS